MNDYAVFNSVLAACTLPLSCWVVGARRRDLYLSARVALLVTLIGYPWDFFAIHLGVWSYPQSPGLRIHDVPLNDLVFMWLCSYLTASFLIGFCRRQSSGQGNSEGKYASKQNAGGNGNRSS